MASTFFPPREVRDLSTIATRLATSLFCPSSCSTPSGSSKAPITGDEPQQPMAAEVAGSEAESETAGEGWHYINNISIVIPKLDGKVFIIIEVVGIYCSIYLGMMIG